MEPRFTPPCCTNSRRGTALVEFALGFFLLWGLFVGVYQFGYAFYVYNTLLTSVSNAAELGSKLSYDTADPSAYTATLKNMVLYGDEAAGNKTLVPNLTASNVDISVNLDSAGMPSDVTVSITAYHIDALFSSFPLSGKPRVTTLYYGRVSGA